ncbi:MAG: hypothetical protein R2882_12730 [Gemmatimonadales bacterium]
MPKGLGTLDSRSVPMPLAAEWGLGYAPEDRSFPAAMAELGVDERILLEAGLLVRRDDGTVIPRFRGRLLFPIHDLRGRVVAFGGRLLRQGEPKYPQLPGNAGVPQGSTLYHLHLAKGPIRREGSRRRRRGWFSTCWWLAAAGPRTSCVRPRAHGPTSAALLKRFAPMVTLLYTRRRRPEGHLPSGRRGPPPTSGSGGHDAGRRRSGHPRAQGRRPRSG